MSKKEKMIDLEKEVMSKVTSGQITMKPKWSFILGSVFSVAGLAGLSISSIFLVNIMLFLLRSRGQMGQWKLETIINSFSWWIPVLAVLGIIAGIWMLKKYDFSYKKNFLVIILGFIASIIISGFIIDQLGLNDIWSNKGMMRKFYRQIENRENVLPSRQGKDNQQNGRRKI